MASLGFIALPLILKLLVPPFIYLVKLLAISDPHINICVGPLNTCVALKQFNLLPPNTLFWSNFIYYPLTHQFEAITLGWIKNFGITLTETDRVLSHSYKVITYSTPRTPELRSCPVFPLWPESSNEVWLTDREKRQADQKRNMLVVVTHLKRLVFNIN